MKKHSKFIPAMPRWKARFASFWIFGLIGMAVATLPASVARAQAPQTGFIDRVYQDEAGAHRYVVFVPANYTPERKWPVILFLHGAGESGTDGRAQTTVGLGPAIRQRQEAYPFIAVFPQCENTEGRILTRWLAGSPDAERALRILAEVEKTYSVNPRQRILTGWSMGGYGAFSLAAAHPQHWSAVVPVAGGGDPALAPRLTAVPLWAFHGALDPIVRVEETRQIIAAIREAGGTPRYTEIPDGAHDIWQRVYTNPELDAWMLNPMQTAAAPPVAAGRTPSTAPGTAAPAASSVPFVPALHIPQAIYVRLGNEALDVLSDVIPQAIPAGMLTGMLPDIYDSTTAEGHTFGVQFSGISYTGQISRAQVKAYAPGRVNVQLQLQNLQLSIGATYVSGGRRSAVAGPIGIYAAHRYPIWLSFDVRPYIDQGRIRLQLLNTWFSIPPDNFSVSSPAGVSTRGLGMTEGRVTNGLVSGLYGSKSRIEAEVVRVVPTLLAQLESQLQLAEVDRLAGGIWPMPVYQPRVRAWAQDIATDANGISIVMGMTVAAPDPRKAPPQPMWAPPVGPGVAEIPATPHLQVGIAPQVLQPMSQLLISADMARVNVLDTPVRAFERLADPKTMAEILPDLKQYGDDVQISAELILTQPVGVSSRSGSTGQFAFEVPGLTIGISIKPKSDAKKWLRYAEVTFGIEQPANPKLVRPTNTTRALTLEWGEDPKLTATARYVPDYQPQDPTIDVNRLKEIFAEGWEEWTRGGPASQVVIPDVEIGNSKLRVAAARWEAPFLTARFAPAGVVITNRSEEVFVYQTRGPYSGWSEPYRLRPGETHKFEIAHPLLYRRESPAGYEFYTLPAGSYSEVLTPSTGGPPRLYQARERSHVDTRRASR